MKTLVAIIIIILLIIIHNRPVNKCLCDRFQAHKETVKQLRAECTDSEMSREVADLEYSMSNYPPGCANKYIDDYTLDARERMAKWLLNRARERVWKMADYGLFR